MGYIKLRALQRTELDTHCETEQSGVWEVVKSYRHPALRDMMSVQAQNDWCPRGVAVREKQPALHWNEAQARQQKGTPKSTCFRSIWSEYFIAVKERRIGAEWIDDRI